MDTRWRIIDNTGSYDTDSVIEVLLKNRKVESLADFFNPPHPQRIIENLGDYFSDLNLKGLEKSVSRIRQAIRKKEKITIWGDFDVDGVSATAILWQTLNSLGADVMPYIPDRFEEGYGLNVKGVKRLAQEGTKLIVTVDCGITAIKEVDAAEGMGADVIITDHHLKPQRIPKAYSITHTTGLCGAGIAWILASQLVTKQSASLVSKQLDLVALATIADLQPLVGVNRALVKRGLEILNRLERPGLAALAEISSLYPGSLKAYAASHVLGPRINAVGRVSHAQEALRLLCTPNLTRARELAHVLNSANVKRRLITDEVINWAKEQVGGEGIIVVCGEGWHEGVIGLVAGRLAEEYGRPAVVISKGSDISRGSARSVNGLNIIAVLRKSEKYLEDVGGHEAAAGFTVKNDNLEKFINTLIVETKELVSRLDPRPVIKADMRLPLENLTYELAENLGEFEPTGLGNPAPVFLAEGVSVISKRIIGKTGKHLLLKLAPGFDAVWFGAGSQDMSYGDRVSLVYAPEIKTFQGKDRLSLMVKDLRRL